MEENLEKNVQQESYELSKQYAKQKLEVLKGLWNNPKGKKFYHVPFGVPKYICSILSNMYLEEDDWPYDFIEDNAKIIVNEGFYSVNKMNEKGWKYLISSKNPENKDNILIDDDTHGEPPDSYLEGICASFIIDPKIQQVKKLMPCNTDPYCLDKPWWQGFYSIKDSIPSEFIIAAYFPIYPTGEFSYPEEYSLGWDSKLMVKGLIKQFNANPSKAFPLLFCTGKYPFGSSDPYKKTPISEYTENGIFPSSEYENEKSKMFDPKKLSQWLNECDWGKENGK